MSKSGESGQKQSLKIVFIITDLSTGGAQVMLHKLLERLDRRFSARVISLTTPGELGSSIEASGVPVEALGMTPGRISAVAWARLVRRLKKIKPGIVHTWMYHADLLGGLAARAAGVPAVTWGIRNSDLDPTRTKLTTRLTVRACAALSSRVPDRVLSCSEVAQRVHESLGYPSKKFVVIPNGFDLNRFRPDQAARMTLRQELGVPPEALLVGMVARRDPQKNHEALFRALGGRALAPAVHVVLAGNGVDRDDGTLMGAAREAGILGNTHFLGLRRDVPQLMAAFDLLVSCSSYGEAFPNILGEAMASGVPCVATDVGDSARIIGNTGRVVPRDDGTALQAALDELLRMPAAERAALGLRARARIGSSFEIGEVVRRYESFYESLQNAV